MLSPTTFAQQSRILNAIRFPLACMVVTIHCKINESEWVLPQWTTSMSGEEFSTALQVLFSTILSGIAVPTFYLISGYFFFYKTESFTINIYIQKLKKRLHTLLIPYLLWNLLYILLIVSKKVLAYFVKGKPLSGIVDFMSENGWLKMFWDCNIWRTDKINLLGFFTPPSGPVLIPMWFIRDLMVVVLITPVIYYIIRKLKLWALLILCFCYITGIWPYIHGFSVTAVFFFSLGAYFSINKLNIVNELRKFRVYTFSLYLPMVVLMMLLNGNHTTIGGNLYQLYIIVGVITIINIATLLDEKGKLIINNKLSDTTFFIYAFHGLIALEIAGMILKIPFPIEGNDWMNVSLHYILKPGLTIFICLLSYRIIKKYMPGILNVLTGNRN